MRALLVLLPLIALVPGAAAQRVDTRRIEVEAITIPHYGGPGHSCRFNAIPALWLQHSDDSVSRRAAIGLAAEGFAPTAAELAISYSSRDGASFNVAAIATIRIGRPNGSLKPSSKRVRLTVDGEDIGVRFQLQEDATKRNFLIAGLLDANPSFEDRITHGQTVMLELSDPGAAATRYTWDVHHLADIPELIDLVHWSCLSPDGG